MNRPICWREPESDPYFVDLCRIYHELLAGNVAGTTRYRGRDLRHWTNVFVASAISVTPFICRSLERIGGELILDHDQLASLVDLPNARYAPTHFGRHVIKTTGHKPEAIKSRILKQWQRDKQRLLSYDALSFARSEMLTLILEHVDLLNHPLAARADSNVFGVVLTIYRKLLDLITALPLSSDEALEIAMPVLFAYSGGKPFAFTDDDIEIVSVQRSLSRPLVM